MIKITLSIKLGNLESLKKQSDQLERYVTNLRIIGEDMLTVFCKLFYLRTRFFWLSNFCDHEILKNNKNEHLWTVCSCHVTYVYIKLKVNKNEQLWSK